MGKSSDSKELAITGDLESAIQQWEFYREADYLKEAFPKWQRVTEDLVIRLWIAKKALSNQGFRSDLSKTSPQNEEKIHTWEEFCGYVGIAKSTADRWLERFIPEEGRVLLPEELRARKKIQAAEKERYHKYLIERYEETGVRSEEWDSYTERLYKLHLVNKAVSSPGFFDNPGNYLPRPGMPAPSEMTNDQFTAFGECFDRNRQYLIEDLKRKDIDFLPRDQVWIMYQIEEYLNKAPKSRRVDLIRKLAAKLRDMLEEYENEGDQ